MSNMGPAFKYKIYPTKPQVFKLKNLFFMDYLSFEEYRNTYTSQKQTFSTRPWVGCQMIFRVEILKIHLYSYIASKKPKMKWAGVQCLGVNR